MAAQNAAAEIGGGATLQKTALVYRRAPLPDYSRRDKIALIDGKAKQIFILVNEKLEMAQEIHTQQAVDTRSAT